MATIRACVRPSVCGSFHPSVRNQFLSSVNFTRNHRTTHTRHHTTLPPPHHHHHCCHLFPSSAITKETSLFPLELVHLFLTCPSSISSSCIFAPQPRSLSTPALVLLIRRCHHCFWTVIQLLRASVRQKESCSQMLTFFMQH